MFHFEPTLLRLGTRRAGVDLPLRGRSNALAKLMPPIWHASRKLIPVKRVLLLPRLGLCGALRLRSRHHVRTKPALWIVLEIEEVQRSAIRVCDFEAARVEHGLMRNQSYPALLLNLHGPEIGTGTEICRIRENEISVGFPTRLRAEVTGAVSAARYHAARRMLQVGPELRDRQSPIAEGLRGADRTGSVTGSGYRAIADGSGGN